VTGNNNGKQGAGGGGGDGGGGHGAGPQDLTKAEYGFSTEFLKAHPEIKDLVDKADNQDWTEERFAAELKETDWYRKLSTAQQQWSVTVAEHPGEAKTQVENAAQDIQRIADSLGVELTHQEVNRIATQAARNQLDSTDLTQIVSHQYQLHAGKGPAEDGAASTSIDQIRSLAADYGQTVSGDQLERMVRQVISGGATITDLADKFRERAKVMVPGVAQQLNTQTLRELMDPYLNMASDELGIPPSQMKLSDPKWLRAMSGGEKGVPMTADQWQTTVRTDRQYNYDGTLKGQGEAAQLATSLAQAFGVR
jgi:hypothetical protein